MSNGIRFKVEKTSNYTVMSNQHFHVVNMSLQSKGLLSLMLSLPEDWDYSINGFTSICKESRATIKKVLKELEELGYLEIIKKPPVKISEGGSGTFTYEYIVYENSIHPEKLEFKWGNKKEK